MNDLKTRLARAAEIEDAIDALNRVLSTIHVVEHECPNCGLSVHDDQHEYKANVELTALRNKLIKWKSFFKDERYEGEP